MIISHKHRFIYIQNRKVAGSSVKAYLARYCGSEDVITARHFEDARNVRGLWNPLVDILYGRKLEAVIVDLRHRRKYFGHIPAALVRSRVPKRIWNTYWKFCIERNPWDKVLSYYHMKTRRPGKSMAFDDWIRSRSLVSDYQRYTDRHGNLLVDQVLTYENLAEELGELLERFGIPFDGELDVHINGGFRSDYRHYTEVYSDEQRRIVEDAFRNEIRLMGYSF